MPNKATIINGKLHKEYVPPALRFTIGGAVRVKGLRSPTVSSRYVGAIGTVIAANTNLTVIEVDFNDSDLPTETFFDEELEMINGQH